MEREPKAKLLNGKVFCSLRQAQILIEQGRRHSNTGRTRSALGDRPPAPAAISWPAAPPSTMAAKPIMHRI